MKTTLLRALRAEARAWWYHADLRRQGNLTEARVRENRSIREDLKTIRTARFATIGYGGSTIYLPNMARLTASWEMPILAHLTCPVVDLRTIEINRLAEFSIKGPMVNVDLTEDETPANAFSVVTVETYVRLASEAGATIR
jgi:hypothetical protein